MAKNANSDDDKTMIDSSEDFMQNFEPKNLNRNQTIPQPDKAQTQAQKIIESKPNNYTNIAGAGVAGIALGVVGTAAASSLTAAADNEENALGENADSENDGLQGELQEDADNQIAEQPTENPNNTPSYQTRSSFDEAFAAARAEQGPGGLFEWNGNLYGTYYAEEVDENMNPYEWVQNDNNTNANNTQTTESNNTEQTADVQFVAQNQSAEEVVEVGEQDINYVAVDTTQNGNPDTVFVDINRDNEADVFIPVNEIGELDYDNAVNLTGIENSNQPQSEEYQPGVMNVDTTGDSIVDVQIIDNDGDHIANEVYAVEPTEESYVSTGDDNLTYGSDGVIESEIPDDVDMYEGEYGEDDDVAGLDHMDDVAGFV